MILRKHQSNRNCRGNNFAPLSADDIFAHRSRIGQGRAVNARPYRVRMFATFDAKPQFINSLCIKLMLMGCTASSAVTFIS
jgi:hypothetical protein